MKKILAAKPSITRREIDYVTDAVTNGWGEHCYDYIDRFKDAAKRYFNTPLVWPTSSCHGALHIVLMALGIGPGDEVIVPDATWTGSVFPVSWVGANPVFVDVLPDTWCIDPEKVASAISAKTKAIIAVHLYGNLCEMDELMAIGRQHGLPVIEDAAEAIGSEYRGRKAGSIADFGVFSFHGTKTLTTGEGGLIITHRMDMEKKLTTIESQGRRPGAKWFWVDEIGLKYKMSNLQAALGLAQIERADELVEKKRTVFEWYRSNLSSVMDISMNVEQVYAKNSYWMPTVVFGESHAIDAESLIQRMNERGIAARPFFYPVSGLPMYRPVPGNTVSQDLSRCGVNLPSYYEMTSEDVFNVVRHMLELR